MKSSKPRILHAEDNADARELVAFLLTQNDCEAVGAESFDEALMLARQGGFDLYLLDTYLPGDTGLDLCKRIREFDSKTPILFYSAAAFDNDKLNAITNGAQGYLTKPADPDVLMAEILRLIKQFPS